MREVDIAVVDATFDLAEAVLYKKARECGPARLAQCHRGLRLLIQVIRGTTGSAITSSITQPDLKSRLKHWNLETAKDMRRALARNGSDLPAELAELVCPRELVAGLAEIMIDGPQDAQTWLQVLADEISSIAYEPRPRSQRKGQEGYSPVTLRRYLGSAKQMLTIVPLVMQDRECPSELACWRGYRFTKPKWTPHPRAAKGSKPCAKLSSVHAQVAYLDRRLAEAYGARLPGETDLTVGMDEILATFEKRNKGRPNATPYERFCVWVRHQGVQLHARNRAMVCVMAESGLRPDVICRLAVKDFIDTFHDDALLDLSGADYPVGGAVFAQPAKNREDDSDPHPARHKPVSPATAKRVRVWIVIYAALVDRTPDEIREWPLFPPKINVKALRSGSKEQPRHWTTEELSGELGGKPYEETENGWSGGQVALLPKDPRALEMSRDEIIACGPGIVDGTRGYGLRRMVAQTILNFGERWLERNPGFVPAGWTALVSKEVQLDHKELPIGPFDYEGIGEPERLRMSYVGSRVMHDAIWGTLSKRLGPDEHRLRECALVLRGLQAAGDQLEDDLLAICDELERPDGSVEQDVSARETLRTRLETRKVRKLRLEREERRWWQRFRLLMQDRRTWVEIPETAPAIDEGAFLRMVEEGLEANGEQTVVMGPLRNLLTQSEVGEVFDKSDETVRRWFVGDPKALGSCPWGDGRAPVMMLDTRTRLVHPGAFDPRLLTPGVLRRLDEVLSRLPQGKGWGEDGSKTRRLRALNGLVLPDGCERRNEIGMPSNDYVLCSLLFADETRS